MSGIRWCVEIRRDDLPLLENAFDKLGYGEPGCQFDEITETGNNTVECLIYEASDIDIRALAEDHHLIFYGWYEEGAEWNPGIFAACEGPCFCLDSDIDRDKPILVVNPDLSVDYDSLFQIALYNETKVMVDDYFGATEFSP